MRCFTVTPREGSAAYFELYIHEDTYDGSRLKKRPFVIICPGGGYAFCGDRDSEPVALAFAGERYNAGVLRYTCRPTEQDAPVGDAAILDVLAAIRYVREHAQEWNTDENKIILEGDSAGGHAAAMAAVYWNDPDFFAQAGELCRPNAAILGYPVITAGKFGHRWSIGNLTGTVDYDAAAEERYSADAHISKDVCPIFLWHSVGDTTVPVENSLLLAQTLQHHKLPYELHLFATGWHGLSLGTGEVGGVDAHAAQWFPLAVDWLRVNGMGPED